MAFYGNLSGATGRSSGSDEANGIKYTDTLSLGGTNVQAVLDILADKVNRAKVIDALDSTSVENALSANQGKVLDEKIQSNTLSALVNASKIDDIEKICENLSSVNGDQQNDIVYLTNKTSELQTSLLGIQDSIAGMPDSSSLMSYSGSGMVDEDNTDFRIGSSGIAFITSNGHQVIITGATFRAQSSTTITTTPSPLCKSHISGGYVNDTSVFIPGSSVIAIIKGTDTGGSISFTIEAAVGSIAIPANQEIHLPTIQAFPNVS